MDEHSKMGTKREAGAVQAGACSQASFYYVKGRTVALFLVPRTRDPKYLVAAKKKNVEEDGN